MLRHCLELMQWLRQHQVFKQPVFAGAYWLVLRSKGHSVVVVAEGCGDTLLKSSGEVDGGDPSTSKSFRHDQALFTG